MGSFDNPDVVRDEVGAELGINRDDLVIHKKRAQLAYHDARFGPFYWMTLRDVPSPPGGPILVVLNQQAAKQLALFTVEEALLEMNLWAFWSLWETFLGPRLSSSLPSDRKTASGVNMLAHHLVDRRRFVEHLLGGTRETPSGFVYIHGFPRDRFDAAVKATKPRTRASSR
jgi:hypothetical protein